MWALSTTENAMTVHAVIESADSLDMVVSRLREKARAAEIAHSTIEAETAECRCKDHDIISAD